MAADVSVPNLFHGVANSHADNHDADNAAIVAWLNTNAVHLDGAKAFTAVPSVNGTTATDAVTADQLVRKSQADAVVVAAKVGRRRAAALAVGAGVNSVVTFDTTDFDSNAYVVSNTQTRIPAGKGGTYAIMVRITCATLSASYTYTLLNGANTLVSKVADGVHNDEILSTNVYLAAGESFLVFILNGTGSSKNFTARMTAVRLTS